MDGDKKLTHNDWGEAWVFCEDCMGRLYSTDGYEDYTVPCPDIEECKEEQRKKDNYRYYR